ncbi:DUF192 domain-containing protein [Candidatus Woesearchaeota archaeon]|nr:DUF192 domain-containing protein [Candidatus Woesearchaeota archaeon]
MIKNTTKKTVIARYCKKRRNILAKTFGLMLKNNITPLMFIFRKEKIVPIHTLLVRKPIDLVYLDRQMKVVDIKENLLPYRFYTPKARAMYVLELPAGFIGKSRTSVGDLVNFK